MDAFAELPARLLSQCGLVSMLLGAAVVWLALQLARTRAAWEKDRADMLDLMEKQNTAYEKLAVSSAKLEGVVLAVQSVAGRR